MTSFPGSCPRLDGEIEIDPATIGGHDDAVKVFGRLADKNVGEKLHHDCQVAPRHYADFAQATKSEREDDETGFRKRFGEADVRIISPGEGARHWPAFQKQGIAAVGFADVGDVREYGIKRRRP